MKRIFLYAIVLIGICSCNKDQNEKPLITKDMINGYVQKGPFLNGSSMSIYELSEAYAPTGKIFTTQIADNSGIFQIKNVTLISQYVQLKSDGFYFNEVTGVNSSAPITLYALTDISDKTSVNVNVLTHLEKSRIEYLLSDGKKFSNAKKQAESEILKLFSIGKSDVSDSDLLNIAEDGDNNAILLAVSIIVQGFRTESELSELLANISTDMQQDGELNSVSLGSLLINDVRLMNLTEIRKNIEARYENLGMSITIPDFEKYIQTFIDSSAYQVSNNIEYPENSTYGENILFGDKTTFNPWTSMAANLPKGTSLKIIIKGGLWSFQILPNGPVNWTFNTYDWDLQQQTFTAKESGTSCDLLINFEPGTHTIEYYENASVTPTRIKTIIF
jgi:hypothetical protein